MTPEVGARGSEREKPGPTEPAAELARLFPDLPADDEELRFQFEGLARTLAELAVNPDNRTPFSVVVRGGWGRGKTTLLRRAKRMLESPEMVAADAAGLRRVETLWFNAWKYPDEESVLAGLLGALLDRLHQGKLLDQVKKAVLEYRGGVLMAALKAAAPEPLRALLEAEGAFDAVRSKRAFHDTFRELFARVSYVLFAPAGVLRDLAGRPEGELWDEEAQRRATLAIFLDDLDRCSEARVVEVLKAINLFLDLPGVCFYLGIDGDRLAAALPAAVRDEGEEFLEKIVQVAFDLPAVVEADAETYIAALVEGTPLARVLEPGGEGQPGDVAVIARALKRRHPRHVKRFLNDLAMGLAVLRNTGRLGDGEAAVPPVAVLAWYLLSETLPAERWVEIRAQPEVLRLFLGEWEEMGKAGEREGEAEDELVSLHRSGLLARHVAALRGLTDAQAGALHLASPPAAPRRRQRQAGRLDLADLDGEAWVPLEGEFRMGSKAGASDEMPEHPVRLSPFRISRYPVTNADYAAYVRETNKRAPGHWEEGEIPEGKHNHPVVDVSWADAEAFCAWLGDRLREAGREGVCELPTEAQWEHAARGGEGRAYPWGDDEPTDEHANFGRNLGGTTPVGSYRKGATPEGVHDLAGNVWEWCRDWYGPYPDGEATDPEGPSDGSSRVLRGGSSDDAPRHLRGAYRSHTHPGLRLDDVGFRVVWSSSGGLEEL